MFLKRRAQAVRTDFPFDVNQDRNRTFMTIMQICPSTAAFSLFPSVRNIMGVYRSIALAVGKPKVHAPSDVIGSKDVADFIDVCLGCQAVMPLLSL